MLLKLHYDKYSKLKGWEKLNYSQLTSTVKDNKYFFDQNKILYTGGVFIGKPYSIIVDPNDIPNDSGFVNIHKDVNSIKIILRSETIKKILNG